MDLALDEQQRIGRASRRCGGVAAGAVDRPGEKEVWAGTAVGRKVLRRISFRPKTMAVGRQIVQHERRQSRIIGAGFVG